mgnify:FL=1
MLLSLLIIPGIIATTALTGLIYIFPETLAGKFDQQNYINTVLILNSILLILYLILCFKSKLNVSALWFSFFLLIPGLALFGYSSYLLGLEGTFYGREFGTVTDPKIEEFPFNIGHPQLKGLLLSILGIWCAFHPTFELTFVTMFFATSIFLLILIESMSSTCIDEIRKFVSSFN